jgi:hypothetical protein
MSSHIYGFDSTNHNWEPVKITDAGKLEVSTALDTTGLATDTLRYNWIGDRYASNCW